MRDATYVLDGLLDHEAELSIEEHYTDTAGFTDHIFALCHLLGFRFAPRIRNLPDKRLYTFRSLKQYGPLSGLIAGRVDVALIRRNWNEILRLAASIHEGKVSASLLVNKLAAYPRRSELALALREMGRVERTLFTVDWWLQPELRRRVTIGLNKGELRNSLAKALRFYRNQNALFRVFGHLPGNFVLVSRRGQMGKGDLLAGGREHHSTWMALPRSRRKLRT